MAVAGALPALSARDRNAGAFTGPLPSRLNCARAAPGQRGRMDLAELLAAHHRNAWQPFTQMKLAGDPVVVVRASGSTLFTADNRRIIDAIGSWWTCIHGHNHPYINRAISQQLRSLEHVMYAGFTHEPAVRLAARLSDSTGGHLPRVFYSDNGSTAVEIGLKMAFQYFVNQGRPEKSEFAMLSRGYHGDTIGTMSVGSRSSFHSMYSPLLFDAHALEAPVCPFSALHDEDRARVHLSGALSALEELFERRGSRLCALVLEPIIQGAGGMNIYPPLYLSEARRLCNSHDVFLVADEVFTGCGRTGTFYACEHAGIWPDIMALSKGLPAGYLPFAATLASEKVYQGFYSDDRMQTLFHGHSMTANPLGCAAANASLDLFVREERLRQVRKLEERHSNHHAALAAGRLRTRIREARVLGSVAALELDGPAEYTGERGWRIWKECIERGVLLRPIGNVVYLTPPYVIGGDELARTYEVLEEVLLAELD